MMEGSRAAGRGSREEGRGRRSRGGGGSDTAQRVLVAIPAIVFACVIVSQGGEIFAIGAALLGVIAMGELFTMMGRVRPAALAGFLALVGMCAAALYGDQEQILLVLAASVPVTFLLSLLRPQRDHISWAMGAVFLAIAWIGLAFAHAILLRESAHGGALLLDVLIGTFLCDTCAYFAGRAFGSRPIAPRISPNKTLEGLIGGVVGGTFFFWLFAIAYQHDWFHGPDALLIGFTVAIATPIGDLFESAIKRDLDVKDAGRLFGAHGGVLDRLDGVFFSVVVGYYVSQAVLG